MSYITEEGLKNLGTFSYETTGYSTIDNYMNYYWEFVVSKIPRSVAPNLITMIGFVFMVLSYVIMLPYDTTFTR
jgi:ethanolaminephosphotransferase